MNTCFKNCTKEVHTFPAFFQHSVEIIEKSEVSKKIQSKIRQYFMFRKLKIGRIFFI
jgi:hypothetical protein